MFSSGACARRSSTARALCGRLLFLAPAVLYFGKAFCDVLMLINGYKLFVNDFGQTALFQV